VIRGLELLNFKAHSYAALRFGEGVNFIHGPNGSGKTSIMEAVSVALFGSQWVRRVGSRWSAYLRRGTPAGEVRLQIEYAGSQVLVVRRFSDSGSVSSGTYLSVNGGVVARGDAEVTSAVTSMLGLGIEEYRNLLYVRQGELRKILQEPEYLDRVLRLDVFDKLDEILRDALGELRARRERAGGRVEELERRAAQLRERIKALAERLAETERRLAEMQGIESEYRSAERAYVELRERFASLAKEREALEREAEECARAVLDADRDLRAVEGELAEIARAADELKSLPEIEDVEAQYQELKRLVSLAERIPPEIRSYDPALLAEVRRRVEEVSAAHAVVKSRLELLRDVIRLARRAEGGRCPICGSPLSGETIKRHEAEVATLEEELRRLSERLEALRGEERRLEELDRKYQLYREYAGVDVESARRRLAELEALYRRKREVESRRAYLLALLSRERDARERLELARARKEEAERRAGEIDKRLALVERELRDVQERLGEAEARFAALKAGYEEYLSVRSLVAELRRQSEELGRELEGVLRELEEKRAEAQRLDRSLAAARDLRSALAELKPLARQMLLRVVTEELNAVFLKLRHKESFKSVSLVESDGRYVVRVHTQAGHIDHGLLSVGEQNLLALSLRVALARALLGRVPFMLFDEPTEHLDEEHRRRVVELVRELASVVPVIIVTSHLGEFEEAADVVIRL
jgi:exonuclease SbcC